MLNWIVIWVASYLFGDRRPLPDRGVRRDSPRPRTSRRRRSSPSSGATRCSKGSTSDSSWRSSRSSSTRSRSTGRRSDTRSAQSASTRKPRAYGGISVTRNYFLAMAIAGAFAGLAGSLDSLGWQFRLDITQIQRRDDRLHRDRSRAARAQHRGRRLPRRAPLRGARHRDGVPEPRPGDLRSRARLEPVDHHPGARGAVRGRPARDRPPARAERAARVEEAPHEHSRESRSRRTESIRGPGRRRRNRRGALDGAADHAPQPARADRPRPRCRDHRAGLVVPRRAQDRELRDGGRRDRARDRPPGDPLERREPRLGRRLGSPRRCHASVRNAARVRFARRPVLRALAAS